MIDSGLGHLFTASSRKLLTVVVLGCALTLPSHAGTTAYTYDALGRLKTVTLPHDSLNSVATYDYDAAGNRVTLTVTNPGASDTTPPDTPVGLTATAQATNEIELTWARTLDADGSPVEYYWIYRDGVQIGSANDPVEPSEDPAFDDSSLSPNTSYSYTVSAVDLSGNESPQSTSASATTLPDVTAPSVPTSLHGSAASGTRVNLSWGASHDETHGSGLAGYEIFRGSSQIGSTSSTSFSDQTANPYTTYTYKVRAYDVAGNRSGFSNQISVTTPDTILPSAPGNPVFSSIATDSATATWTAASDNVGVTGYRYSLNGGSNWTNVGNVHSVNLASLSPSTGYTMLVQARDAAGNWGPSGSGSFSTAYWIVLTTGIKPPQVLPPYNNTYSCGYYIDYYYFIEYEWCFLINGNHYVYFRYYYPPPTTPSVSPGYNWNGETLVVESTYYGTY